MRGGLCREGKRIEEQEDRHFLGEDLKVKTQKNGFGGTKMASQFASNDFGFWGLKSFDFNVWGFWCFPGFSMFPWIGFRRSQFGLQNGAKFYKILFLILFNFYFYPILQINFLFNNIHIIYKKLNSS